jgi:hypothetical protein
MANGDPFDKTFDFGRGRFGFGDPAGGGFGGITGAAGAGTQPHPEGAEIPVSPSEGNFFRDTILPKVLDPLGLFGGAEQVDFAPSGRERPGEFGAGRFGVSGGQQGQLIQQLQQRAAGNMPSAAELQLQRGLQQAQAQAQGLASAQRGISPGMAARMAQSSQARQATDVGQASAILRAQEQAAAEQQLAALINAAREQQLREQLLSDQFLLGSDELRLQAALADAGAATQQRGAAAGAAGSVLGIMFGGGAGGAAGGQIGQAAGSGQGLDFGFDTGDII